MLSTLPIKDYNEKLTNVCKELTKDEILGNNDKDVHILYAGFANWSLYINSGFKDIYSFIAYYCARSKSNNKVLLFKTLMHRIPNKNEIRRIDDLIKNIKENS